MAAAPVGLTRLLEASSVRGVSASASVDSNHSAASAAATAATAVNDGDGFHGGLGTDLEVVFALRDDGYFDNNEDAHDHDEQTQQQQQQQQQRPTDGQPPLQPQFGAVVRAHSAVLRARCPGAAEQLLSVTPGEAAPAAGGGALRQKGSRIVFDVLLSDVLPPPRCPGDDPDTPGSASSSSAGADNARLAEEALVSAAERCCVFLYTNRVSMGVDFDDRRARWQSAETRAFAAVCGALGIATKVQEALRIRDSARRAEPLWRDLEAHWIACQPPQAVEDAAAGQRGDDEKADHPVDSSTVIVRLQPAEQLPGAARDDPHLGEEFGGERLLVVHRAVAAARSSYLERLVDPASPWSEASSSTVVLRPPVGAVVTAQFLLAAMRFLYSNDLEAALAQAGPARDEPSEAVQARVVRVVGLLESAEYLGVHDLIAQCEAELASITFEADTVFHVWKFALSRPTPLAELASACREFAAEEFSALAARDCFKDASREMMAEVLGPGDVEAPTAVVLAAVRSWRDAHSDGCSEEEMGAVMDTLLPPSTLFNRQNRDRLLSRFSLRERLLW